MEGFLALTRNPGEDVIITTSSGERIIVRLGQLERYQAKLLFHADDSTKIMRAELLREKESTADL